MDLDQVFKSLYAPSLMGNSFPSDDLANAKLMGTPTPAFDSASAFAQGNPTYVRDALTRAMQDATGTYDSLKPLYLATRLGGASYDPESEVLGDVDENLLQLLRYLNK